MMTRRTTSARLLAAAGWALVLGACVTSVGEDEQGESARIGNVQQQLLPTLTRVWAQDIQGEDRIASATCPSGTDLLGIGAHNYPQAPVETYDITDLTYETDSQVVAESNAGILTVLGVCSPASTQVGYVWATDGSGTAHCPSGMIAVGGGGSCSGLGSRLYRSRPYPDTHGSVPTGWVASCTSSYPVTPVTTYVNCVDPGGTYDFSSCRTRKASSSDGSQLVTCPGDDYAIAAGAYCGSSASHLMGVYVTGGFEGANGFCYEEGTVNTYAICCDADVDT